MSSDQIDQINVFLLCVNRLLREALIRILGKRGSVSVVGVCGYSPETAKRADRMSASSDPA